MPALSVIRLGAVDGFVMTNAFVALAESVSAGERGDTLVTCHPSSPFANAGFHQEVDREIDLEYCSANGIPVVRRVIGGGAIADGPWEQDYFLIASLDSQTAAGTLPDYYGRMLEPISGALLKLGVRAERQGLNDLAVGGRKISANGAVDIEHARVLTGDILLDLNVAVMSGILRVPDEKFRDKVAKSMAAYLTSLKEQLGGEVRRSDAENTIVEEFASRYAEGAAVSSLTGAEEERLRELVNERKGDDWLFERSPSRRRIGDYMSRVVKIKEGMFLCRHDRKFQKLIRITMLVDDGRIADIAISGDFFTVPVGWPVSRMEDALKGAELDNEMMRKIILGVVEEDGVTMMGTGTAELAEAIVEAADHPIIVPAG